MLPDMYARIVATVFCLVVAPVPAAFLPVEAGDFLPTSWRGKICHAPVVILSLIRDDAQAAVAAVFFLSCGIAAARLWKFSLLMVAGLTVGLIVWTLAAYLLVAFIPEEEESDDAV